MQRLVKVGKHLLRGGSLESAGMGDIQHPFGEDFGLAIIPNYISARDGKSIRDAYMELVEYKLDRVVASDGRLQMPPLPPSSFMPLVERMEADGLVPKNHLNNQTANYYQPGDFIRAHVDNLFVYDDVFAIASCGGDAIVKFVHVQNGEELEAVIPGDSLYIMSGPARYVYFHMVLPCEEQRYSLVFRRSILNSDGGFRPVCPQLNSINRMQANGMIGALFQKQVGGVRVNVDDAWLERENLGTFDTAKWVKGLRPLQDWSLMSQLDEDEARVRDMMKKKYIRADLEFRFQELRDYYKSMEEFLVDLEKKDNTDESK